MKEKLTSNGLIFWFQLLLHYSSQDEEEQKEDTAKVVLKLSPSHLHKEGGRRSPVSEIRVSYHP